MKKTAGFFIAENLKNPLMGKRNQNACVMRAKITYTQKHINVISNLNKRKLQKLYNQLNYKLPDASARHSIPNNRKK